jgi:tetratricopeptide (TPR) repeat protein
MIGRGNGTIIAVAAFLLAASAKAAEPEALIHFSDSARDVWAEYLGPAVFAKSAEVRLRERPAADAALVDFSAAGLVLHVRQKQNDWVQVEFGWLPADGVVTADQAFDYFTAQIDRSGDVFDYLGRACASIAKKDYEPAQADLMAALRVDPRSARAYALRAAIGRNQRRYDDALADCDRAISLAPRDPFVLSVRGVNWLHVARYDLALADFDGAVALFPTVADYRRLRGGTWYQKGDDDKALADFNEAVRLNPLDARAHAARGAVWAKQRKLNEALSELDEAIRLNPTDDAFSYINRGWLRCLLGQFELALADCSQAISIDPNNPEAYRSRAAVYERRRDFGSAIADMTRLLELRPGDADAYAQRGWLRCGSNPADAMDDFEVALRLDPRNTLALIGRAYVRSRNKEYDAAIADTTEALRHNPTSVVARLQRAYAFETKHELQRAKDDFSAVLRLQPDDVLALVGRARVCNHLGELDNAIDDCTTALKFDPRQTNALTERALARAVRKEFALAIDDCTLGIAIDPTQAHFWNYRGLCWQELGDLDKAIADYRKSLELQRNQPGVSASLDAALKKSQRRKRLRLSSLFDKMRGRPQGTSTR